MINITSINRAILRSMPYFTCLRYKYQAMRANRTLGIHTDMSGLSDALVENVVDSCMNIT